MANSAAVGAEDTYPALQRFLLESGLQRTLKSCEKETVTEGEAVAPPKGKRAKALAEMELVAACQLWLDGRLANGAAAAPVAEAAPKPKQSPKLAPKASPKLVPKSSPKLSPKMSPKLSPKLIAKAEAPSKGKRPLEATEHVAEEAAPATKKSKEDKKDEKDAKEKKVGVPFKRIDEEKWTKAIVDDRLKDNTHTAKVKFGQGAGDSWADKASEDLLKVKGKGFRKEMQKKKKASWRGGGEIDQGVNSVKFPDSEDE